MSVILLTEDTWDEAEDKARIMVNGLGEYGRDLTAIVVANNDDKAIYGLGDGRLIIEDLEKHTTQSNLGLLLRVISLKPQGLGRWKIIGPNTE